MKVKVTILQMLLDQDKMNQGQGFIQVTINMVERATRHSHCQNMNNLFLFISIHYICISKWPQVMLEKKFYVK